MKLLLSFFLAMFGASVIATEFAPKPPKRPEFEEYNARYNSLLGKQQIFLAKGIHIEDLAEAGFFYRDMPDLQRQPDHVECFHCLVGITNWEQDEVPWEAHVQWEPLLRCEFLINQKGHEYIDNTLKRLHREGKKSFR